jgi:cell division protein FtsZ
LFTEAPRQPNRPTPQPTPASRPSLFGIVTGALRRSPPAQAAESDAEMPSDSDPDDGAAQATQAAPPAPAARPTVRAAHAEDAGLDIPAFLRRQSS